MATDAKYFQRGITEFQHARKSPTLGCFLITHSGDIARSFFFPPDGKCEETWIQLKSFIEGWDSEKERYESCQKKQPKP